MGRPRKTVNAAMLAAAIGIDRLLERDVGRIIAGDDGLAGIAYQGGPERRKIVLRIRALPAVIDRLSDKPLIPVGLVGDRASAFSGAFGGCIGQGIYDARTMTQILEQNKNKMVVWSCWPMIGHPTFNGLA